MTNLGFDRDLDFEHEETVRAEAERMRLTLGLDARPIPTLEELINDPIKFMEELLWIRPKSGPVCPFYLNPVQHKLHRLKAEARARGYRLFIELKARREGVTTYEQGISMHGVCTRPDESVATIAHREKDAIKIFRMASLFYEMMPEWFRPERPPSGNRRELWFPRLRSIFEIGTAGSGGFARGSTYRRIHCTEVAYWPGDLDYQETLMAGITEAASEGEVVAESTADGYGNLFQILW
jgi:hypothetical protein